MRKVYLQAKMVKDPASGKMIPRRNRKGEIEYLPDWRGKHEHADGRMTTITFFGLTKTQAQERLNEMQAEQNKIRRGDIALPDQFNKQLNLPFAEVVEKFIRKGKTDGGRRDHPWSDKVADAHIRHLKWWRERLKLKNMTDLIDRLADVEDALQGLIEEGSNPEKRRAQKKPLIPASKKTRNDYLNSLYAFCTYAKRRKFLREHPLTDIKWHNESSKDKKASQDKTVPKRNKRRDFTGEEYAKLIGGTPLYRSIVYETAAATGFRRNELMSLTLDHLHVEEGILDLHAEDDKARVERHQSISSELARKLYEFGMSGEALRHYKRCTARSNPKLAYPAKPLLYVPEHIARKLDEDLERLGIPKQTEEGKLVFHCFRNHYISKLFEVTDNIKVIQELARHSDIRMTQNYARTKKTVEKATVEDVYRLIQGQKIVPNPSLMQDF